MYQKWLAKVGPRDLPWQPAGGLAWAIGAIKRFWSWYWPIPLGCRVCRWHPALVATLVATVNDRGIWELPAMGSYPDPWFLVELVPNGYSPKQDTFTDAVALANRLGPKTELPDNPG
jgi:hypothetical protein